jgi:hypothetical protein
LSNGVLVQLGVQVPKQANLSNFEPRLTGYVDQIEAIYLTVTDSNGQKVYESSTTDKINPSFNFNLLSAGTYTFTVEGKRSDGSKVFTGQVTQEIRAGQLNTVTVVGRFVKGSLEAVFEIDSTVWDRYNIQSAQFGWKKESSTNWESSDLQFATNSLSKVFTGIDPTMYDVKFVISLTGKNEYVEPRTWTSGEVSKKVMIEPDKTTRVKFKVLFENGLKVVVEAMVIDLPYVEGVRDLSGMWDKGTNTLTLSWKYETPEAVFKIYKQISDEEGNFYYEEVGTTQDKSYSISNFTQDEYDRICGIAINTIVNGKESGLVVLSKKELYKASITVDANLSDWNNLLVRDAENDGKIAGNEIYRAGISVDQNNLYIAGDFTKTGYYNFMILIDISSVSGASDTTGYGWNRSYKFENGDLDFVLETWGDDFNAWKGTQSGFTSVREQVTHVGRTDENGHKIVEIALPLSLFGITDVSKVNIKAAFVLTGWIENGAQLASDFLPNQGYETTDGRYTIYPVSIRNVVSY